MRSALHRAGAAALSQLLEFPAPTEGRRTLLCPCGQQAHYREQRSKPVLTAVGLVEVLRPYYLCAHCGVGQLPADVELEFPVPNDRPDVLPMTWTVDLPIARQVAEYFYAFNGLPRDLDWIGNIPDFYEDDLG